MTKSIERPCAVRLAAAILAVASAGLTGPVGAASAQGSPAPYLSGRVMIGLAEGWIAGDFCLSNFVVRGDSLTIVLNHAFSIDEVTGVTGSPASEEEEPGGAAIRYTFIRSAPDYPRVDPPTVDSGMPGSPSIDSPPPTAPVCVRYSGDFPLHRIEAGEYRESDESNVIAFTGSTLRARGISRWHPTPFDPRTGLAAEAMAFRVEVDCAECRVIFVNGGQPEPGPGARFESAEPRELLLVAGELAVRQAGGLTYLGREVPVADAERLAATIADIAEFLEAYVGVPFGPHPEIVSLAAMRQPRRGELWGFLSDPALALIGMTVPEIVEALESSGRPRQLVLGFLAHELAHRYFGWRLGAGTAQRDLFGEPFAVYLEMKAVRHFLGEEAYLEAVERLREGATRFDLPPLSLADADAFAVSAYRYRHAPAALFALEDEIGEAAMRLTLIELLRATATERHGADLAFLGEAARRAGASDEAWRRWMLAH